MLAFFNPISKQRMTNFKNKHLFVKTGNKPVVKKKPFIATDAIENALPKGISKSRFPVSTVDSGCIKNAAQSNNNSEDKLKLVMNAALDAIICIDTTGIITFWNSQAAAIFGWSEREALGQPLAALIIPEQYRSRHIDGMALYLKTGKGPALNKLMELSAIRQGGEEFPIELTIKPIKQEGEEFFCAFIRDITAKKISEKKLKQSEARLIEAQEVAKVGSWETDLVTLKVIWSDETYRIFELDASEFETSHPGFLEFVHPDDRETVNTAFVNSLSSNTINTVDHRILTKSGHTKFVRERWKIYQDDQKKPIKAIGTCQDITEQKKSEIALQNEYQKRTTILESIDDGFFAIDNNSLVTYWNRKAEELLGEKRETVIGRNLHEMFTKPDSKVFYENYQKAIREKSTVHFEAFSHRSNKWFAVSAYASDHGLSVYFKDFTEQKVAEEKLQKSELRYRTLIEQASDTICISDAAGKFIEVNSSGCSMFGYSREEILKLSITDVLFLEDLKLNPLKLDELKAGHTTSNQRRIKRKDGTAIEVELNGQMLEDGSMIVFGRDITERKKAETKIKESELRYRSIIEQATDAICIADPFMKIIDVNPCCCEMLGYNKEEFLLLSVADIFLPEDLKENPFKIAELKSGKVIRNERRLKRKDGTLVEVEINARILEDGRFMVFAHDITERKEAENNLKESNERYNFISRATNDMVWDWDLVTNKVYRNKEGWKKIFRTVDEEIENISIDDWDSRIHPDDLDKVNEIQQEIQTSKKDFFEVECRVLRDDGIYAFIHDRGQIIRNVHGEAVRMIGATQDITQRKEAELQVAKSEFRFRSLVQNSAELICIFDERGYFKYSSPAIKEILGFEPDYTIEKNAFAFIHPDDSNLLKDYLLQMNPNMHREMPLLRFKNTLGEWRWIESRVTNMTDNSEVAGYVFNCRDVTERKIAEAEIEKLSIIARETSNAVIITNPEGEIVWVNEGFTQITEFEFKEVIGKKPGSFLQGDETNLAVVRYMRNKLKKIEPFECDILNYSKSGRKYWLRIQAQPQFDETGKLKYFFAIETDITKEKEAEEILKEAEEQYRYLFNNNPASIFIWDIENLEILEVNNTMLDMYGYNRKEILSKTILDLRKPAYHDKIKFFAKMASQKHDFVSVNTWKHLNKQGEEMYMNIASHRMQFKGRDVVLALATNISEKILLEKKLEKERLLKQQEITQAVISAQERERQELGGELHDNVNQILAGSLLYLGLAKKELNIDHEYLKETDTLINTAIEEIRNLSHSLIPPSLHQSEFMDALKHLTEVTQKTSSMAISLQASSFDENSIPDKLKLTIYRIVQEQINNILKHAAAQKVIVHLVKENEKTLLCIKDDGIGFDTTKKANGVGLMNIKTRASLFNGEVSIISSPGKGCEVRVLFN